MKTDELRESYLAFFEQKGCVRRPSDVLVPRDDPTVLFTPAGMNQFKNEFMGIATLEFTRATTCQKCMRTGDISNVGVTAYHHTFFEMLGNFSFGDYFKKEAIHWAWEFLTDSKWLGLHPDRLSASVYKGQHGFDEEAYTIWKDEIALPADRIACLEEDENYWPASAPSKGPDGVCGPCSEIFYHPEDGSGEVEIWNLVFTQFNRVGDPPDNLNPLPSKNIDTGMGLERTAAVLQGVHSNFEIDILKPLCFAAADVVGLNYEFDAPHGRALRRIADHVRAITFCVHEGVMPDREKENYVVRQLLRRALLEGYLLGKHEPFLYQIVPAVVDVMGSAYSEISKTVESVQNSIREEESQFLDTIERGLSRFNRCVAEAKKQNVTRISGDDVFLLHTEDGFLIELTEALATDNGMSVDKDRFDELMKGHVDISKGGRESSVMAAGPLDLVRKETGDTEFLGYDSPTATVEITGLIVDKKRVDHVAADYSGPVGIVVNRTPFYGEAGGQVGDTGRLVADGVEFEVVDTQRHKQTLIVHDGRLRSGTLNVGDTITAEIDAERRAGIRRAHSATHILHHALHQTIGDQATQRGSKVENDVLRFDFAHKQSLTKAQIGQVEDIINSRIASGVSVSTKIMNIDDARQAGAMALFGEKYPDQVRVVRMGEFSIELCGGTHLSNTGQVGLCKVISEEPVAKGVRRIVALTGAKALQRVRETENLLNELVAILKTPQPEDLPRRVQSLQDELREAKRELAKQSSKSIASVVDDLVDASEEVNGVKIVAHHAHEASRDSLRDFIDQVRAKTAQSAVIVGTAIDGKVALTAAVSKELVEHVSASDCVKAAAKVVGGGGGGRPDMAEAGGKNPENIDAALAEGAKYYRDRLQA